MSTEEEVDVDTLLGGVWRKKAEEVEETLGARIAEFECRFDAACACMETIVGEMRGMLVSGKLAVAITLLTCALAPQGWEKALVALRAEHDASTDENDRAIMSAALEGVQLLQAEINKTRHKARGH